MFRLCVLKVCLHVLCWSFISLNKYGGYRYSLVISGSTLVDVFIIRKAITTKHEDIKGRHMDYLF